MKLKFDPSLEFQQDAINAVVRAFEGQPAPPAPRTQAIEIDPAPVVHAGPLAPVRAARRTQAIEIDPARAAGEPPTRAMRAPEPSVSAPAPASCRVAQDVGDPNARGDGG